MDPNLSYPIIINATLNQPPQNLLSNPAITALLAGVITLLGIVIGWVLNFFASSTQEKRQFRIDKLQKQRQAYSRLIGIINVANQLHQIQGLALATTYWLKSREKCKLPMTEYGSSIKSKQKVDAGSLVIARNSQSLWEIIGLIQVLFPISEDAKKAINSLNMHLTELTKTQNEIKETFAKVSCDQKDLLDEEASLFKDARKKFEDAIPEVFNKPANTLADYLRVEIDTEEKTLTNSSWWQFWRRDNPLKNEPAPGYNDALRYEVNARH